MDYKIKDLGGVTNITSMPKFTSTYEYKAFRTDFSDIRKITIGDPKTGFSFTINTKIKAGNEEIIISKIVRDENSFFIFGEVIYLIYAKKENGEEFLWNAISNMPLRIEFSI